jgi:hypothetical protein
MSRTGRTSESAPFRCIPASIGCHPLVLRFRVPPEIIFDQGIGSLFIVRVAGKTYDRLALQSIEYAVNHLGTTLIMAVGHDQCGAVTAAVAAYPDPRAGPMLTNLSGGAQGASYER